MSARARTFVALALTLAACEPAADPPMRAESPALADPSSRASGTTSAATKTLVPPDAGTEPRIWAIALETSVYEEPRWGSRRLGYLRAGASAPRSDEPVEVGGRCPGGWFRVEPRGFVCAGPLASLDPAHPVIAAAAKAPRTDGLPYVYALSRSSPPPLYARVPTQKEQIRFEHDVIDRIVHGATAAPPGFPAPEPTPDFLAPGRPILGLGNEWRAPDRVFLGLARPRSGFALLSVFQETGRTFGLTTQLEVVPLDRTRPVRESVFHGVVIDATTPLPIAFAKANTTRVVMGDKGLEPGAHVEYREAIAVLDEPKTVDGTSYLVARDGSLLRESHFVVARAPKHTPAFAENGAKWIDVSIPRQVLVAFEGARGVYATLVSTGVGGAGDPETEHATIQGMFAIYEKHVAVTMDGHESSDAFDLRDVPFVQYFHEGFALHAAYWHDDFGHLHSHGCVNLAPKDAAWLFAWTDPHVPEGWHGVTSKAGGTTVFVHD